jgi:hypothetical protein
MRTDLWRSASAQEARRERRAAIGRLAAAVRGESELARRLDASGPRGLRWAEVDRALDERRYAEALVAEWQP